MGQSFRITLLFLLVCISTFAFSCNDVERGALLKFKHSFIDEANHLDSWVGKECCSWKGVGCDNITGNVIRLDLGGEDSFPTPSLEAREVNPALLELKYLTHLDLSYVDFNGSRFPEFFGSMNQLQYLNLSNTLFNGKVPHNLGNLTYLVFLDLGYACWYCDLDNLEWAFGLEKLQYLDLSGINLTRAHESLSLLHHLPSLSVLNLAYCELGNSHTLTTRNSTFSYSALQHLDLSENLFSGSIPYFLQNLSSIRFLDLSFNNFTRVNGGIMSMIDHLCKLKHLDFSYNQLQEEVSESGVNIPRCRRYDLEELNLESNKFSGYLPIFGRLSSLKFLDLSGNNLETIPSSLEELLYLEILDLSYNNFKVASPIIGNLSYLKTLDLSLNNLETIPSSLGRLSSLETLGLSYNNLNVVDQVILANLSSLRTLDISSNFATFHLSPDWMPPFQLESLKIKDCKLNSPIPKWILSQEQIWELDLSNSGISGPLPTNIGKTMPSLGIILLAENQINGTIPRSLCELESLQLLDLQKNMLSGEIPDSWENSSVNTVELSSNKISGHIPQSLVKVVSLDFLSLNNNSIEGELPLSLNNSANLELLDVGRNNLEGEIPPWINGSNFPNLDILILRENRFNGSIPQQLCSLHSLQIIDFARNNLSETIPQCFGHFEGMGSSSTYTTSFKGEFKNYTDWSAVEVIKGKEREYTTVLKLLVNMDLSCNQLVGVIPAEITNLSRLLSLNLSHNNLNGTIPKETGKMESLESLDLSSNNLSGSIPESISSLDSLSDLNLSFNNLQGLIPTGRHLQTLNDSSIYMGNPGLCGEPLPNKCNRHAIAHPPTRMVVVEDGDNKPEKMWFYMAFMVGFTTGCLGVIVILAVHKKWRNACFQIAEELADLLCVKITVRIARANRER